MTSTADCPHPLSRQDAAALIGVLATLEGHVRVGDVDPAAVDHLRRRLVQDGVISEADEDGVPRGLERLNHSVRAALGEYG
jgi:hypothetical protein